MSENGFLDVGYAVRDSNEVLERVRRGSRCRVTMTRRRLGTEAETMISESGIESPRLDRAT